MSGVQQPKADDPRIRRPAIEEPGMVRWKHRWADAEDSIRNLRRRPNSNGEVLKGSQGERGRTVVGFASGAGEKGPRDIALKPDMPGGEPP